MKLIFLVLSLAGMCYLFFQVYTMNETRISTETIETADVTEDINASGVFFRTEQLIEREEGGVYELLVGEWEKLAKNQSVAVLYSDDSDYETNMHIKELEQKLAQLKRMRSGGGEAASPAAVNTAIYSSIYQASSMSSTGRYSDLSPVRDTLLSNLLNREASFAGDTAADDMIKALQSEIDALRRGMRGGRTTVKVSASAGLFSSGVDGFEDVFDPALVENMTPEELDRLLEVPPGRVDEGGLVGKIIRGNKWYFTAVLDEQDSRRLSAGNTYSVIFTGGDGLPVDVGLIRLSRGSEGRYIAVFYSEYNIQKVSRMRKTECEIILRAYTGFRVPKAAVRIQDGVEGVYCLVGVQARFKPIIRVYETEGYYICESDLSSTKQLFLYDEIIVSGKNLYDGKIVK